MESVQDTYYICLGPILFAGDAIHKAVWDGLMLFKMHMPMATSESLQETAQYRELPAQMQ